MKKEIKKQSKIIAITYADKKYARAARLNIRTAKKFGKVNEAFLYSPKDLDVAFKNRHKDILMQKKGGGYWLWKPYFIKKTLEGMREEEVLIYTDAAIMYTDKVCKLLYAMEESNTDRMFFLLGKEYIDAKYTKRDAFILMNSDEGRFYNSPQVNAAVIVFKRNKRNIDFCTKWLEYAFDSRILTDIPNVCGRENYPEFLMHRHDQSILSLLAKKYDSVFFRDPTQWGEISEYSDEIKKRSSYPCIFNHHRIAKANSVVYVLLMQNKTIKKIIYKKYLLKQKRGKTVL